MPIVFYRPLQFVSLMLIAASVTPVIELLAAWLKANISDVGLLIGLAILAWMLLSVGCIYWVRHNNYSQASLFALLALLVGISVGLLL